MIMKMHSYMTINGYLQFVSTRSLQLFEELRQATLQVGGWDEAIATARAHRGELEYAQALNGTGTSDSEMASTVSVTPAEPMGSTTAAYTDVSTANALRKRLAAISLDAKSKVATISDLPEYPTPSDTPNDQISSSTTSSMPHSPHLLVYHPRENISMLAKEYSDLESELISSGPNYVRWPHNISFRNFAIYQVIPTLVYELEYPRTDRCVFLLHSSINTL
jgi:sterol O-acyltransferase